MFESEKKRLIDGLKLHGIDDTRVLNAIESVPREAFITQNSQDNAYLDSALPIECGQTISQPYIVARMTQTLISQQKTHKVLEVGSGSGYQTAILAEIFDEVYSIERIYDLHQLASDRLKALSYRNVHLKHGDGYEGWPEHAPFDGIIVTAAPKVMPFNLVEQLDPDHGTLVVPIGHENQQVLKKYVRVKDQYFESIIENVRFVPMLKGTSK